MFGSCFASLLSVKVTIATTLVIVSFSPQILPQAFAQATAQIDAGALVRQSVRNYERDWREAMSWSYRQTDVTISDDTAAVDVSEIVPVDGTPYERLLIKHGQKLPPAEQKKEARKYEKTLRNREAETPSEREERIRKYEAERAFIKDIPDAYDFQLAGETVVNGRAAWIIKMSPKAGFVPTTPHGSMLKHIAGTIWLDKEDLQWAKAQAQVIDRIEIGWILARVGAGTRFLVRQTRVADGLWLPDRIVINGIARVLLVHDKVLNEELTFSGYQKGGAIANANPPADSFR